MRWSEAGPARILAGLAGAYLADDDGAAPNLSVVVGSERGAVRAKHQLYLQGRHLTAPSRLGRLVRSIVRAGTGLALPAPAGCLVLTALPVVRPDGTVVLVDSGLNHDLRDLQSRLDRDGFRCIDGPSVAVDPATGLTRIPDAAAAWGIDRARLAAELPERPGDDPLGAIELPVVAVVVATTVEPPSAATAVAAAAGLARDRSGRVDTATVVDLARLLEQARFRPYVVTGSGSLADLLR